MSTNRIIHNYARDEDYQIHAETHMYAEPKKENIQANYNRRRFGIEDRFFKSA
jgi:hypothetical protein